MHKMGYKIPDKYNFVLFLMVLSVSIFQLFALPLYLLPKNIYWAILIIPLIPFNNMMWFLIHEAIHKNLNTNQKLNELGGRILSIFFGASFCLLSFGHLMHHQMNRHWESEYYNAEKNNFRLKIKYFLKLFFGVYFTELLSSYALFLLNKKTLFRAAILHHDYTPEIGNQIDNYFYKRERIKKLRLDMSISFLLFLASLLVYNIYWPVLIAIIVFKAISISLMDNVFHYNTPYDNSIAGKEVAANKLVRIFILNGNYHGIHHNNPKVPWTALPQEAERLGLKANGTFTGSMLMQFEGPKLIV